MNYGAQYMLRNVEAALRAPVTKPLEDVIQRARVMADVLHETSEPAVLGAREMEQLLLQIIDHLARLKRADEALVPRSSR